VSACPTRIAQAYLELAVLVRALQGLADMARIDAPPDRSSLGAGLFDLRENLERAAVDLRCARCLSVEIRSYTDATSRAGCAAASRLSRQRVP
jgi:hypothetical protein